MKKRKAKSIMFKKIVMLFMPSSDKLAKYAAESIQKTVNSTTAEREAAIAKYS